MIRKVPVTDLAFLRLDEAGEVSLCIGAIAYGPTDWVPTGVLKDQGLRGGQTAAQLVDQIFIRKSGLNRSTWPDLAVRFVARDA